MWWVEATLFHYLTVYQNVLLSRLFETGNVLAILAERFISLLVISRFRDFITLSSKYFDWSSDNRTRNSVLDMLVSLSDFVLSRWRLPTISFEEWTSGSWVHGCLARILAKRGQIILILPCIWRFILTDNKGVVWSWNEAGSWFIKASFTDIWALHVTTTWISSLGQWFLERDCRFASPKILLLKVLSGVWRRSSISLVELVRLSDLCLSSSWLS